jgi:hypothetical protein
MSQGRAAMAMQRLNGGQDHAGHGGAYKYRHSLAAAMDILHGFLRTGFLPAGRGDQVRLIKC